MEWSGRIKSISLELPEDLHTEMRSRAPKRSVSVRQAYIDAATAWLGTAGTKGGVGEDTVAGVASGEQNILAGISKEDRQIVLNLVAMIRDGEREKLPPVRLLLKTYKPKVKPPHDPTEDDQESGKHSRRA